MAHALTTYTGEKERSKAADLTAALYARRYGGKLPPYLQNSPLLASGHYDPSGWSLESKVSLHRTILEEAQDAVAEFEEDEIRDLALQQHAALALKVERVGEAKGLSKADREAAQAAELQRRLEMGIVQLTPPTPDADTPFGQYLAQVSPLDAYVDLPAVFVLKQQGETLKARYCINGALLPRLAAKTPALYDYLASMNTSVALPSAADRR